MSTSIYSPPRWSVTYFVADMDEIVSKGSEVESVGANIVLNPLDFPPSALKLSLNLTGLYRATVGSVIFRIRANGTPAFSLQPTGEIIASLSLPVSAGYAIIAPCMATIEMPASPILVQVTLQQLEQAGEVAIVSSQVVANAL